LPWALAHSEDVSDLDLACDFVDLAIAAHPNFRLFAERNKPAIDQHRQVLKNSAATRNETPSLVARLRRLRKHGSTTRKTCPSGRAARRRSARSFRS
jgi:hypothetical protein